MKNRLLAFASLACLLSLYAPTKAEEAPPPRRMPRTPVSSETLEARKHDAAPSTRDLQGPAAIIDGDKLRIGDTDMRLFGIVPPQLSASFGPQARNALDQLAGGQSVACSIRDRDRDGRLLAICRNTNGADMGLELLKRGLAVTARGTLSDSDLASAYIAAEQSAQSQKIGLWSISSAAAAKEEAPPPHAEKPEPAREPPSSKEVPVKLPSDIISEQAQARIDDAPWSMQAGFIERYQNLIAALALILFGLSYGRIRDTERRNNQRNELRAVAAALRGELSAARGICWGRARAIETEDDDHTMQWPRIRTVLYAAYVGRIGMLGAELARQISAIYGQASDYAAFYGVPAQEIGMPKRTALETMIRRIDEVLPKLALIEQSGVAPRFLTTAAPSPVQSSPAPAAYAPPPRPATEIPTPPRQNPRQEPGKEVPTAFAEPAARAEVAFGEEAPEERPPAPLPRTKPARNPIAWRLPSFSVPRIDLTKLEQSIGRWFQRYRQTRSTPSPRPSAPPLPQQTRTHANDYAALIEADMARYQQQFGRRMSEPQDGTMRPRSRNGE